MTGRQGPPALQPQRSIASSTTGPATPTGAATRTSRHRPAADGRAGEARAAPLAPHRAEDRPNAPIVPAGSVTGRSLTLVITIMCFLACLTAGAVYMMNQSASAWLRDIASEVTVQVEVKDRTDVDKLVGDVTRFLSRQPGIVNRAQR